MAIDDGTGRISEILSTLRSRITKNRNNKRFNEQTTKASLILPVLEALGWNTNDPEDVLWEYKPKPRYNPVDFALMLQRTPSLFLEAKALRESLGDDRMLAQLLTYASVAGVEWVALSNGDEYRIYNATAPVPVEEKLFRKVSLSSTDDPQLLQTFALLSKSNLQDKRIGRLWASHFVDRQVKNALEELLAPDELSSTVVRAIRKVSDGRLRDSEIRASLRRASVQIDFPEEPELPAERPKPKRRAAATPARKEKRTRSAVAAEKAAVTLDAVIKEGLLQTPAEIFTRYRGQQLVARVESDGTVTFDGANYSSLSTAGGMARKPFHKGDLKGRPYPQTNGWTFWQFEDPHTNQPAPVDVMRERFLKAKRREAGRFQRSGS